MSNTLMDSPLLPITDPFYELSDTFETFRLEDLEALCDKTSDLIVRVLDFEQNPNEHPVARHWTSRAGVVVTYGMRCAMEIERRTGKEHPVFRELSSQQFLVGHTRSGWTYPKWTLTEEYVAASRSLMIRQDPDYYRKLFPEISHEHEVELPVEPMEWFAGEPEHHEEDSPYCQCEQGSAVTSIDIGRDDGARWWVCARCKRTIETWIIHSFAMREQLHTFEGGILDGQTIETPSLLDDEWNWSQYQIVGESWEAGGLFSEDPAVIWGQHNNALLSTAIE